MALWLGALLEEGGDGREGRLKAGGVLVMGLRCRSHVHLIPIQNEGDLNPAKPKLSLTEEEFKKIAGDIQFFFIP